MRLAKACALVLACAAAGGPSLVVGPRVALGAEPWFAPIFRAPRGGKPPPPPPPLPAPSPADVDTAEQLYAKLEFDEANRYADRVLKLRGLTHDQIVRAYRILAVTHAFIDHEDAARDAFIQLLTFDPDYAVDVNLGPKVTTPFYEARGFWRAQSAKPGVEVVTALRAQDAGALRVTTRDPTHVVKKVVVGWRWTPTGEFTQSNVGAGSGVSVDIGVPPAGHTRLEYYAQAIDDRDDVAFEAGNPNAPKTAIVEASAAGAAGGGGAAAGEKKDEKESGGGIASSPVFWTVIGVVVAGGATAAFFALRPKGQAAPTEATLTPALQCGASKCQ